MLQNGMAIWAKPEAMQPIGVNAPTQSEMLIAIKVATAHK
jgi:hypothetical protein